MQPFPRILYSTGYIWLLTKAFLGNLLFLNFISILTRCRKKWWCCVWILFYASLNKYLFHIIYTPWTVHQFPFHIFLILMIFWWSHKDLYFEQGLLHKISVKVGADYGAICLGISWLKFLRQSHWPKCEFLRFFEKVIRTVRYGFGSHAGNWTYTTERGKKICLHFWIKVLFPLCTCSIHVWTVLLVSNHCIKYCRRSCGHTNSATKCEIWPKYICHLRGHNSAIMTWIKFPFLYACSMHVWTVLQVATPSIKYGRRSCGDKNSTTNVKYVRLDRDKTVCRSPFLRGHKNKAGSADNRLSPASQSDSWWGLCQMLVTSLFFFLVSWGWGGEGEEGVLNNEYC